MRKIPNKLRTELANDPAYKVCCLADSFCEGRIEWHHNLIFAGRQVNEKFCILPLCQYHHRMADHTVIKEELNYIMWSRATEEEAKKYSKAVDYVKIREVVLKQYGNT